VPLVVLPDVEKMAIDFVRVVPEVMALTGGESRVYTQVPESGAKWPLLVIFQIGGTQQARSWLHRARLQLEAWDGTPAETEGQGRQYRAHQLARTAYSALLGMVNLQPVGAPLGVVTECNGILEPAWQEDEPSNRPRYIAEIEVVFHPVT
jgi:hypothetical protein